MKVFKSIKWALGLLLVFGLIIATNLIDRNNYVQVKNSVITIYEDRLVVEQMVYEMTDVVFKKELALVKNDSSDLINDSHQQNHTFMTQIEKYEETKLTRDEATVFKKLKEKFALLIKQEEALKKDFSGRKKEVLLLIAQIKDNLFELSQIQLKEGKRQMAISKKAVETIDLFTKIEVYMLIFLAILIQIIVLYQPKNKKID